MKDIKIEIKGNHILKLVKCNVLVAEIYNDCYEDDYIIVTKEVGRYYDLYTYKITMDELVVYIEFDSYYFVESKE